MTVNDINALINLSDLSLLTALPEIFLSVAVLSILIAGVIRGDRQTASISWLCVAALAGTAILVITGAMRDFGIDQDSASVSVSAFSGMFINDEYAAFLKIILILGLIFSIVMSIPSLEIRGIQRFELPILMTLSGIGMMFMVSANHLLTLYMALELQSLCLYVLAAIQKGSIKSSEAGLKYFILGALSSGILLFGMSMIYGFTGSLSFPEIFAYVEQYGMGPGLMTGMVFVLIALAFKISAVPFHMWTPDVYEGAPSVVTAMFVIVPKIAALGLLMRLLFDAFGGAVFEWSQILMFLSVASMVWGAFAGLVQNNIKRLLAYSSIGNMGYALLGLIAGTQGGVSSVLIYLTIYMAMTAGTFACLLRLQRNEIEVKLISDMAGLVKTNPLTTYLLVIFMFSMSGLPPMAGFFGKLAVFQSIVAAEHYVLAVIGVLTSVIAAYYYLRVIKVMMFDEAQDPLDVEKLSPRRMVALIGAAFTLLFIIKPDALYQLTDLAAQSLVGS